jgi:hypothetical protein
VICARFPALNFMRGSQRLFEIGVAIVGVMVGGKDAGEAL